MKNLKQLLIALSITLLAPLAIAQSFPAKQAVIITSFSVGSGPDSLLRKAAPELSKAWGVPVIIENKPGGQGGVALEAFNKAVNTPQTYHILQIEGSVAWAYPLIAGKDDLVKHLTPVGASHYADLALVTAPNITTPAELAAAIKKNPNFGSWSLGSQGQILSTQVVKFLKLDAEHIPYKDFNQWLIDTSSGRLSFGFVSFGSAQAFEQSGKLKFVAIGTNRRDPDRPNLPTVNEFFGNKINFTPLGGLPVFYIKDDTTPLDEFYIVRGLKTAFLSPDIKTDIAARGYKPWTHDLKDTKRILAHDKDAYLRLLKEYNINMKP